MAKVKDPDARILRFLKKRGQDVVRNPPKSMLASHIPQDIRLHHLLRSLQVLKINQDAKRFTVDEFDVFVGKGAANRIGSTDHLKRPPGTTRRSLGTLTPEWAVNYLPYPGRIYFTNAIGDDLWEAVSAFLLLFRAKATKSSVGKSHQYKFSQSLTIYVDNQKVDLINLEARLQDARVGTTVQIINVAPHAAQLELWYAVMYDAAREVFRFFAPGLGIDYNFINSDAVGLTYGKGTGGPSRVGKRSPVVYALPLVTIWIPKAGKSNSRLRPIGMWRDGYTKGGKPIYRKRRRETRGLLKRTD